MAILCWAAKNSLRGTMILSTCVYNPGVTVYVSQWRHIPLSFYSNLDGLVS